MGSVLKPGKLDLKTKEVIALGMGLTVRCKYCIGIHTQKALDAGATPEKLWEVTTVAVMMGGGPARAYVAELLQALAEFMRVEVAPVEVGLAERASATRTRCGGDKFRFRDPGGTSPLSLSTSSR